MRLQEIIVASRGVSFSSDLIQELCERGIRMACLTSSGKPFALITSPMLTATVETRRAQFAAYRNERGAELCRWIVAGKLHNQEKLLRYFAKSREGARKDALDKGAAALRRLRRSALAAEGNTPDEVRAQVMGWRARAGAFTGNRSETCCGRTRVRRAQPPGRDRRRQRGAQLRYGILTAHVWGAVMNAGLEPSPASCMWTEAASHRWCWTLWRSSASRWWTGRSFPGSTKAAFLTLQKRNTRRGVEGERGVARARAAGGGGTAPGKTAPGAFHRADAGAAGGQRGGAVCGRTGRSLSSGERWRIRTAIPAC